MSQDIKHLESFIRDPDIPETELVKLIMDYKKTECPELHEKIVNGRMNFITNQCKKFSSRYKNMEYCEILSGIFDGITRAIKGFDPNRGAKFSTYSVFWIRVYLANAVIEKGSSIALSHVLYSKVKKISNLIDADKDISDKDLSDVLKVSEKKIRELKALRECMNNYSIHSDPYIEYQMEIELNSNRKLGYDREFLESCINELNERNSYIIREKFGLNGDKPKTLQEISSTMGITHQRVHQILQKTLPKLKRIYNRKRKQENEPKGSI